jgi:integrase
MPQVELSDRFCKAAKATGAQRTDYFDTVVTGLVLRVSASSRVWYHFYTRPGTDKRARRSLGKYPDMTLAQARQAAREARAEVGEGKDPAAEKRALEAALTVRDLVENYIARQASQRRSSKEIARRLRRNVSAVIGHIRLSELHKRDITRSIDAVKDRGAHVESNRVFEDLRAMLRWARGRGDLDSNITEGMRRPTETTERDRVLTPDEIATLWLTLPAAAMQESTRRVLRLLLLTGQRNGEVCGMTREELDLERALWTIPAARSKNGREHVVPLSGMALEIIREQLSDVDALAERMGREPPAHVFPAPGQRAGMTNAAISKAVLRNGHLGLDAWVPHDLRRTAASSMAELGVPPFNIAHVLNHTSVTKGSVTQAVYNRYDYAREKREALNVWADRLAGIVGGGAKILPIVVSRKQSE